MEYLIRAILSDGIAYGRIKRINFNYNDILDKYTISDVKNAIDLTVDIIPGILKLQVDSKFKENLETIKDKFSVFAEYTPLSEKEFSVRCKIVENNITIFDLQAHAGSREQAKQIVNNWNTTAINLYPSILKLLVEGNKQE